MDGAATYAQRDHLYTCWKQMPQAKILLFPSAVIIIGAMSVLGDLRSCINNNRLCTYQVMKSRNAILLNIAS